MADPAHDLVSESIPHWYGGDSDDVLSLVDGDGVVVTDDEGNEYLDFNAQLYCVNAGHGDERIVEAIREQASRIAYVSASKHNDTRTELASRLAEITPGELNDVFFSVSGSEANEAAVQFAREYTGARKVLTRYRSYHGATYGAGSLTGDPETRNAVERYAAMTGAAKFLPPVAHRSPFDADSPEDLARQAADHLAYVIQQEGPDSIAAVLMEPVGGTSGAYPAPADYWQRVRDICDEYDILLIADEVITGFGRCGEWFGIQTEDVVPDLLTFAKGITSAYVPLAGVAVHPDIAAHLRESGIDVGQTFAGHPLACAAGVAALDAYEDGLIENARARSDHLEARLRELEAHDAVGDVRGRGLLWAVEFTDPETGEPFLHPWVDDGDNPVRDVIGETQERGVLVGGGRPKTQIILSPPLPVTDAEIDRAVDAIDSAIASVFE
ncbi:aminotransferase family protein [Haloplanus aerogenes]|uniref:Aminotransferase class III-fold pyridoxal phosphate-dependent enzyme n=1 Tax=Haloplanus aerogenes TaxID=660522 RepID=A0A3M0CWJ9_9EURY|nr:aminotransferase class III-fold pyridoxal phosphate-dependent enzyme [Haloplanus aerogenes]AZH25181.1 aminotransferase class III-fold pyridoxal phosphate-dependent enzyme [Haloplanus aerogenes]RMB13591.1 taurine--2-oxoglutarate transaminase [Haloplanus aerogenes]